MHDDVNETHKETAKKKGKHEEDAVDGENQTTPVKKVGLTRARGACASWQVQYVDVPE